MNPETKSKLEQVFAKRQQVEIAAAKAKSDQEVREEAAVAKFKALRETLIRPTLQAFVDYLASKGHTANIVEKDESFEGHPARGTLREAQIELTIMPKDDDGERYRSSVERHPHFSIRLEKSKSKVWLFESTMWGSRGGHAGSCGQVDIDKLDQETIEVAVTKTIASIFA